jgi:hypothetical protein
MDEKVVLAGGAVALIFFLFGGKKKEEKKTDLDVATDALTDGGDSMIDRAAEEIENIAVTMEEQGSLTPDEKEAILSEAVDTAAKNITSDLDMASAATVIALTERKEEVGPEEINIESHPPPPPEDENEKRRNGPPPLPDTPQHRHRNVRNVVNATLMMQNMKRDKSSTTTSDWGGFTSGTAFSVNSPSTGGVYYGQG